jgi:hypothetical protein
MILFVFEGGKAEPTVFDSIGKLFLSDEELCVVRCKHDLPTLYSNLKTNGYDLFRSLLFEENGIEIPEGKRLDTLFSQIFLFFDYDFQNRIGLEKVNVILDEMLDFFDDETDNGKLYINYPMVESLKYTKELPDENYWQYVVTRQECVDHLFKGNAEQFAYVNAKGFRFIDLSKTDKTNVAENWEMLKHQNVCKANYLVSSCNIMPEKKDAVNQTAIFEAQKVKYVGVNESVAILNSFPIFIYEYLK